MYDSALISKECTGHLSLEKSAPLPCLVRLNASVPDPYGIFADLTHDWRYCPNQLGKFKCGIAIPNGLAVCPYCTAPLTFTPAPANGAERRMPMAAAA
eukprot:161122-Heterocapsa_arctica.AAC.1